MRHAQTIRRLLGRSWNPLSLIPQWPGNAVSLMSTSGNEVRNADRQLTNRIIVGEGPSEEVIECDEEPHMIPMPYAPGYVSFQLGEPVDNYEIVRKLGWGNSSSVWLGRRCNKSENNSTFIAIKALSCFHSSEIANNVSYELEAYMALRDAEHPGKAFCVTVEDVFAINSAHGGHLCFTSRPYALSLQDLLTQIYRRVPGYRWSIPAVRNLIKQVLMAVECIHSVDFVHTDIKVSNIFLDLDDDNEGDGIAQFLERRPSRTYPPRVFSRFSSNPTTTVMSEPLVPAKKRFYTELPFRLADLGEAIPVDKINEDTIKMPTALRAPEIILGYPWGKAVDIWAVGCLALEVMSAHKVFVLAAPPDINSTEAHLSRIEELLGPFPSSFLEKCSRRDIFFDENGQLRKSLNLKDENAYVMGNLVHRVSNSRADDHEVEPVINFLRRTLSIDPSLRPSAAELLEDPWLTPAIASDVD